MSGEATCTEPSRCTVAVGEMIFHKKALLCWGGLWAVTADSMQTTTRADASETRNRWCGPGLVDGAAYAILLLDVELQASAKRVSVGLSHQGQADVHPIGVDGCDRVNLPSFSKRREREERPW